MKLRLRAHERFKQPSEVDFDLVSFSKLLSIQLAVPEIFFFSRGVVGMQRCEPHLQPRSHSQSWSLPLHRLQHKRACRRRERAPAARAEATDAADSTPPPAAAARSSSVALLSWDTPLVGADGSGLGDKDAGGGTASGATSLGWGASSNAVAPAAGSSPTWRLRLAGVLF